MSKSIFIIASLSFLIFSTQALAQNKHCGDVDDHISTIDKHADNFYSLANYQFDDESLFMTLRSNSRIFNDTAFETMLSDIELAIKRDEKNIMIKIAPISRYLNEWNVEHCS